MSASSLLDLAREDAEKSAQNGVDLNPYSTSGSRGLWQLGFDGKPCPEINAVGSFNWRAWERGRLAKVLLDERSTT